MCNGIISAAEQKQDDANAPDNIDAAGGWNPATGKASPEPTFMDDIMAGARSLGKALTTPPPQPGQQPQQPGQPAQKPAEQTPPKPQGGEQTPQPKEASLSFGTQMLSTLPISTMASMMGPKYGSK